MLVFTGGMLSSCWQVSRDASLYMYEEGNIIRQPI